MSMSARWIHGTVEHELHQHTRDLSSCLSYATGNSSTPSSSCCSSLGNVVQSQPWCLCSLLNGAEAANGPAFSPSLSRIGSPADGSDEQAKSPTTTTIPSVPQGTGSKTVPNTSGRTYDGNIIKSPIHLATVALLVAATRMNF
ncbi:unnamed protein product [Fraxinus pennsylvanica]|uniref:Bifunctional inhibitor/plant lipid transfer protein/seed storage helical domain-containing protein n=1 Tax=Fraxinus pennsylvanica TaxID=56036 RepID=A0AAD2ACJ3_9LAMI|nr:unnamed protein product [Fraxinus pennsylvanica]